MTDDIATVPPEDVPAAPEETAPEAPFGWMTDPATGERRPKKRPGRRPKTANVPPVGKSPSVQELQALGGLPETSEDSAPGALPKGKRKAALKAEPQLPPFRAGVIAKGVNGLYRKAGRIIRMWDPPVGSAVIAITRAEEDDDVTVGEAWEELARTNPRIRAFLLRLITGGAWTALFTAHVPVLMAIAMKDGIRERIPFLKLAETLLTDDPQDGGGPVPSDLSQMMGGIGPQDVAQMMAMAQGMMGHMAANVPRPPNTPREPVNGMPYAPEEARQHDLFREPE